MSTNKWLLKPKNLFTHTNNKPEEKHHLKFFCFTDYFSDSPKVIKVNSNGNLQTSPPKQKIELRFPHFTKKNNIIIKNARSLSPQEEKSSQKQNILPIRLKNEKDSPSPSEVDFSKYKKMRFFSQESEIKLQTLYRELLEESDFKEKTMICLKMIKATFLFNEKMTQEFHQIVPILETQLFCKEELKNKINLSFNEHIIKRDQDYVSIIENIIMKLEEIKQNYQKEIEKKDEKIRELYSKIQITLQENQISKNHIFELQQDFQKKLDVEISKKNEEMIKLKEEIEITQKKSDYQMKNLESKLLEYEQFEEKITSQYENQLKILKDEKNSLIKSEDKERKEHETLKILFGKLSLNHKTLLSSVVNLKEQKNRFEEEVSDLINENQGLKIRAAVAWDEMTPRPSYEKVLQFYNQNNFFQKKSSRAIANDLSEFIIEKFQKDIEKKKNKKDKKNKKGKNHFLINVLTPSQSHVSIYEEEDNKNNNNIQGSSIRLPSSDCLSPKNHAKSINNLVQFQRIKERSRTTLHISKK